MKNISLIILGLTICGFAQARPLHKTKKGPCHDKIKEICGDVKPGDGRIKKCIEENKTKFPQECQDMMSEMDHEKKEMREEFKKDFADNKEAFKNECKADIEKLCGDVKAGHGAKLECLDAKQDQASASCKAVIVSNKEERKDFKEKRKSRLKEIRKKHLSDTTTPSS